MHKFMVVLLAGIHSLSLPHHAAAEESVGQDSVALNSAMAAINNKNFDLAVSKADEIIGRFEARREADTAYVCTSGMPDTLNELMGAAVAADKGEAPPGKVKTHAISTDICNAYFLKGFALVDLKRREEALANFETAIAMDLDNNHYLNELGEWYKTGRQWQKSLEIFTKASLTTDLSLAFWEDKAEASRHATTRRCRSYRGIAFNYIELAAWDDAKAALQKCLALTPDDPASLNEIKYIEENSGKKK